MEKYISWEIREYINNYCLNMDEHERKNKFNDIYNILKKYIIELDLVYETDNIMQINKNDKLLLYTKKTGKDYILNCIERKIGKTNAIVKLSLEFNLPILVSNQVYNKFIKDIAKEYYNKNYIETIIFKDLKNINKLYGRNLSILLIDQDVDILELRKHLDNSMFKYSNVVGINQL